MSLAVVVILLSNLVEAAGGIRFTDVAAQWEAPFRHHHGGQGDYFMIETMGSGVVIFDYDGDGDHDLLYVDSGDLHSQDAADRRLTLYRNDGPNFADVTDRSQLAVTAYGMGATAGDLDDDGDLDLYITAFGRNQLFLNEGDGTFVDVTAESGVGNELWGASAGLSDVDRDGDLDLYVTNYVGFSFGDNPPCGDQSRNLRSYCHPDVYEGLPDHFYRNRGDATFEDVTQEAGFGRASGKGLGVVFGDMNSDGWPDLYVANDMTANFLFVNRGDGSFEEMALLAGAAFGDTGDPEAGMGVDMGDLDGDGRPEIIATHVDFQTNALYSATGGLMFVDRRYLAGLAEPSFFNVGFGVAFADFDQDADLDIVVANGHIIDNIELFGRGPTFKERNQIFVNDGSGRFHESTDAGLDIVRASRGLAVGDLDSDGDLDLTITNSNDDVELYRNDSADPGHWLQIDLDATKSNRFGVGAQLIVHTGNKVQRREIRTASSYLSQNALTVHLGLGAADRVDELTITWPSGKRQAFRGLPVDQRLEIFE